MSNRFEAGEYDVIVIGAGHAGVEAGLAAARIGMRTLLATLSMDNISLMPCNPSVGGPAKGHLVREIDALGGEMGVNADKTCIQFRMLNTGKGPAVQALRAQADKKLYQFTMKETCERQENLDVKQLLVDEIIVEDGTVKGVVIETGEIYRAPAVIIATGTYLRGRIIIGETTYSAGPNGQRAAMKLTDSLKKIGLRLMRFKTGTPARVDKNSLDFDEMTIQPGDDVPRCFSFMTDEDEMERIGAVANLAEQVPCWLSYTNEETHKILRDNLSRAPMANGVIKGVGPRYCPSIETKIARFPDKEHHQLFIEPEGLHTQEMYVQGMSTSMPMDVQIAFLHTIPGLRHCRVMRAGYAIEYDCLDPTQLKPTLEVKNIHGLFSAGQSNGTSGYEEAAAQGLIAGVNAAMMIKGEEPLVLKRSEAYIGVLIDDLVTKGTNEPYRLLTSRAEYRLLLRQDNADMRLTEHGRRVGLVTDERYAKYKSKMAEIKGAMDAIEKIKLSPSRETNEKLKSAGLSEIHVVTPLYDFLRRADVSYKDVAPLFDLPKISRAAEREIDITITYDGYIKRQREQVRRMEKLENHLIPETINYDDVTSLRLEAREKMNKIRPRSVGQAARISGVSPADVSVLLVYLEQQKRMAKKK
ncbi:MAG: tRNA uridine-5-carboxymethylaminomethyl(34) synthesis enzyme MnmG [Selenomonadaceae bacterium]